MFLYKTRYYNISHKYQYLVTPLNLALYDMPLSIFIVYFRYPNDRPKMELTQFRTWTIFHICLFITFLVSSFIINIVQAVLYFTVGLLSKTLYRTINSFFVWQIHAQVSKIYCLLNSHLIQ